MIRYLLAVLAAVFWVTSEAAAIECSAERLQSGKGHWSWRMIDGKKCWYPGRPGMAKDRLHWPAATTETRARKALGSVPVVAAEPDTASDAVQPEAQEETQPNRAMTFKERWPH
jgi:hypothetical protein